MQSPSESARARPTEGLPPPALAGGESMRSLRVQKKKSPRFPGGPPAYKIGSLPLLQEIGFEVGQLHYPYFWHRLFQNRTFLDQPLCPGLVILHPIREYVRYDVSKVHTVFHCGHWLCAPWGENFVLLRTFGAGRSHCNNINTWGNITVPDFSLSRRGEVKR